MPRKKDLPYNTEGDVFATRLRNVMEERGTNQTKLSALILEKQGQVMQRQTISQYMNGQSKPDTERLTLLCRALGVSADYLLGISDHETQDVGLQTALKYTDLSARAVHCLYRGIALRAIVETIGADYELERELEGIFSELTENQLRLNIVEKKNLFDDDGFLSQDLSDADIGILQAAHEMADKFGFSLVSPFLEQEYLQSKLSGFLNDVVFLTVARYRDRYLKHIDALHEDLDHGEHSED